MVVAELRLLEESGSRVWLATVAVFVTVTGAQTLPQAAEWKTRVRVAVWLGVREKPEQLTTEPWRTQPWVEPLGSKMRPAGTGSLTTMFRAGSGPLSVTTRV